MYNLKNAIIEYAYDTENSEKNYNLALIYESLGQTASAITYFLRAAERATEKELAYECLIRISACFERQGNRRHTSLVMLKHALYLLPRRPEAYFLLSRFHERNNEFVEGYTLAKQGMEVCNFNIPPLRTNVEYPGEWGLVFERAVTAWWWGKKNESVLLFNYLLDNYLDKLDHSHIEAALNNLKIMGVERQNPGMLGGYSSKMIVDYFTYYDETCKEMLELRYHVLKDHVDKFVVTEANRTQTGELIPFKLRDTLKELNLPLDKFEIVEVEIPEDDALKIEVIDVANSYENKDENTYKTRVRERLQKDGLNLILDKFGDMTYFIVSDCDEIINPNNIRFLLDVVEAHPEQLIKVPLVQLEGKANLRVFYEKDMTPKLWDGGMYVCKKHHLVACKVNEMRSNVNNKFNVVYVTEKNKRIEDMGWHFTWMGGAEIRKKKLNAMTHRNEKLRHLATGSFDSPETLERMEREPVEGDISVGCETGTILVKYPFSMIPNIINENEKFKEFFLWRK